MAEVETKDQRAPGNEAPVKLIIWDLDDTLWQGTLAEGERPVLHAARAALVRTANARGVLSSLCSKNAFAAAKAELQAMGIWDQFVFPHIAFGAKGPAVRAIIEAMQLRPANVLFVDDNPINLAEVRHLLPEIRTFDSRAPDCDARLAALLAAQPAGRSRLEAYRLLERKAHDRAAAPALSNEDFLRSCQIRACAPTLMDNLDFVDRVAELINRSNQLNYTGSRVGRDALAQAIIDLTAFDSWSIFAWDKYGRHGLVGFVMVDRGTGRFVHFTFSCRVMHMGLEAWALAKVRETWPEIDASAWEGRFSSARPDWIAECPFHDPEIRAALLAEQGPQVAAEPAIRIMFDCQSGGIAHFSRYRAAIDFDNAPRLFALRHMDDGSHADQRFPPLLVYGAAVDYLANRWRKQWHLLDGGLYIACVERLCALLHERDLRMLVVLPPEDAPEEKYRFGLHLTPDRCRYFNAVWRRAAQQNPDRVWILDLAHLVEGDEMADVTHYHAGLLRKIAGQLDGWVEALVAGGGAEAEAA